MYKDNSPQDTPEVPPEPKKMLNSKSKGSFVQNPDQNKEIHKEALGPNTKR